MKAATSDLQIKKTEIKGAKPKSKARTINYASKAKLKAASERVFSKYEEVFRKLAQ